MPIYIVRKQKTKSKELIREKKTQREKEKQNIREKQKEALKRDSAKGTKMGLNVSTKMGFENRNFLRNAAREILQRGGASKEASSKIIDTVIFDKKYVNSQSDVFQASAQISFSKSLNETLKYLKSHTTKKDVKTPKLGELWDSLNSAENDSNDFELFEFVLDEDAENIFAAA